MAAIEAQDCPECRKAATIQSDELRGYPELVGSPKQIAWASEIRERKLRLSPEMAEKLMPETSAKWWIDNR